MSHLKESRRRIGFMGATALVVANMIGTGIFTSTGFLVADMPSRGAILLAWGIGGGMAMLGALCYGALARSFPISGGEYTFLSRTIHPSAGYVSGWISLFVGFSAPIAAAAYAAGVYIQAWVSVVHPQWIGSLIIVFFGLAHGIGVRQGVLFQNLVVGCKILLLTSFLGWSAVHIQIQPAPPVWDFEMGTFSVSLVWIFFAYAGWNAAVYIGGEVRDPERNLPRAMLLGTGIVIVFYVALNALFLWGTPMDAMSGREDVARIAANHIGGNNLAHWISVTIILALLTSISAMMMAGPRVYAKMSEDGYLPAWMRSASPPGWANIAFQVLVALVLLWVPRFKDLLTYIGFTLGIGTALTVVGLIRLRWKDPKRVHVPGWPVTPFLFLVMVIWVTWFSAWREPIPSLFGFMTLGLGWGAWRLQEHWKPRA
ncbi:amino acid permease [bacterium]|nr:amino acid permease [bacterium]MDG1891945.1 amino acid permease [Verrucomicrobiota bacterium]